MAVLQANRRKPESPLTLAAAWRDVWLPSDMGGWLQLVGLLAFAGACGMVAVASIAARRRHTR